MLIFNEKIKYDANPRCHVLRSSKSTEIFEVIRFASSHVGSLLHTKRAGFVSLAQFAANLNILSEVPISKS